MARSGAVTTNRIKVLLVVPIFEAGDAEVAGMEHGDLPRFLLPLVILKRTDRFPHSNRMTQVVTDWIILSVQDLILFLTLLGTRTFCGM